MSDDLACARARKAAEGWIRTAEPDRVHPAEGVEAERLMWAFQAGYLMCICEDVLAGDQLLLTAQVLDAASRGGPLTQSDMERAAKTIYAARDELALERATGQRQLDDATSLMVEARDLFRYYEGYHREKATSLKARVPDDPAATTLIIGDCERKADRNKLMAIRLDAWLRGEERYPVSVNGQTIGQIASVMAERPDDAHPGFAEGGFVKDAPPCAVPIELSSITDDRATACAAAGFIPWRGGDGPPADWDGGEFLLDWGSATRGEPRFTVCHPDDCSPDPGLWHADRDPTSYATIIGYRSLPFAHLDTDPADDEPVQIGVVSPARAVALEPVSLAALIKARQWLLSAESLIAEAAEHIHGVTGARDRPGSDSADLVARLDAWLTPMATRPADEGAEKEARRSSTHHGD